MKKYQASSADAKVIGAALQAYEDSIEYDRFKHLLADYGLTEIDPETWYPQQLTLDIQKAIKSTAGGSSTLISIGMKIIDNAKFPPMKSLEEAVEAFAASYPMNFQDQSPEDLIHARIIEPGYIQVVNGSPHSDEMIYGYVYSLVHRFKPQGTHPTIEFEDLDKVDEDGDTIIDVRF